MSERVGAAGKTASRDIPVALRRRSGLKDDGEGLAAGEK